MENAILILVGFIAIIHLYFLWLEMFAWTTKGPKVFKSLPKDLFEPTMVMAANQGLYNGFLATGLIWSFLIEDFIWKANITIFFLSCVLVAGIFGGVTIHKKVFFIQGLPALMAIILILFNVRSILIF